MDDATCFRFWAKVHIQGPDDCWPWTAGSFPDGYGCFRDGGKVRGAHRISYEIMVGDIPKGAVIDHLCRTRHCVNPRHLEAVSHRTNVLRGVSPSAACAQKTHCARGHEFSPENTFERSNGGRGCRECKRRDGRESMRRRREASR